MEILKKTKEEVRETNKLILSQGLGFISSAFVLVAALAWNEAIKDLISRYAPSSSGLISRFLYAIIVTIIAVLVTNRLNNLAKKYSNEDKNK